MLPVEAVVIHWRASIRLTLHGFHLTSKYQYLCVIWELLFEHAVEIVRRRPHKHILHVIENYEIPSSGSSAVTCRKMHR
jgi:hypothetical protein